MGERNKPHDWEVKMKYSFKEKRAMIWSGFGAIFALTFWTLGMNHAYTPLSDLGISTLWGLGCAVAIATWIKLAGKH